MAIDYTRLKHLAFPGVEQTYGRCFRARRQMWKSGNEIQFRARAVERGILVLDRGYARIE